MIKQGLMTPSGQAFVDLAKKSGTWEALVHVQESVIPADLKKLFYKNKTAFKNFQAFPPSSKRIILEWILNAKKPETRQKRFEQTVELAPGISLSILFIFTMIITIYKKAFVSIMFLQIKSQQNFIH